MCTTIEFDDDVARAVEELRCTSGLGVSEAVNDLTRRGLLARPTQRPFEPIHRQLGLTIDVSNIADALDLLEGAEARQCWSTPTSCSTRSISPARSTPPLTGGSPTP